MNNEISRRTFMSLSATGVLASSLAQGQNAVTTTPSWARKLQVANASEVQVLQFTDVHFFNGVNRWPKREERQRNETADDMRRLVDHAKPDVLLVTGDLWHENPEGRGEEFMTFAIEQCDGLGVPWAFTWGNHDQVSDYAVAHGALATAKHSLYGGAKNEGNYVVTLQGKDGQRLAEMFCLNTRDTGVDDKARQFVKEASSALDAAGQHPMRLGAFHIPIKQYQDVWDNGTARGIIGEDVCMEAENRSSLAVFHEAGIQAVVCGHDHVNDYSGVMEGVDMIYGRATGHSGYGGNNVPKGAKLYTFDPAQKTYKWVSLLPDGTTWQPGMDERTDIRNRS